MVMMTQAPGLEVGDVDGGPGTGRGLGGGRGGGWGGIAAT